MDKFDELFRKAIDGADSKDAKLEQSMRELAKFSRNQFMEFVSAGFDFKEALYLTGELIRSMMSK